MPATYRPPVAPEADPVALAALLLKQDSATAATDAELAAAVATLNTAVGLKQDASTAATDAELAAAVALDRARLDAVERSQPPWGVEQALNDRLLERVSVFDNFTAAERADALDGTATIDTTAKVQAIIDYLTARAYGGVVRVPEGAYLWNNLIQKHRVAIVAESYVPGLPHGPGAELNGPVSIRSTAAGWSIDTPAGLTYGATIAGLRFRGPGAGVSCGGYRHRNVRYGGVVDCSFENYAEWAVLQEAGLGSVFRDNYANNCLLDRARSIDKATLPHGVIELRGTDSWLQGGEYTASLTDTFGAAVVTGTAQAGSTVNNIILASGESATDQAYAGYLIEITAGTGSGQINYATAYNGATRTATMLRPWTIAPDATSVYKLIPARCFAAAIKGTDIWMRDGMYELSEAGVWVSTLSVPHAISGVTADLNAGPGWVLAGAADIAACKSWRSSRAGDGQYDSWLLLRNANGTLTGCSQGALTSDTIQPRHGINDVDNTSAAQRWSVVNCPRGGSRRGSYVRNAAATPPTGRLLQSSAGGQPNIDGYRAMRFAYAAPNNITSMAGLVNDEIYTFSSTNSNATFVHGAAIVLKSGANVTLSATTTLVCVAVNSVLFEV